MILGAVLAGGRSARFGGDKALAEFDGHTLLSHAVDALSGWCEHVIVVGRETAPAPTLPDWPRAGMGPLAGIAAALHHARDEGYEFVLTCGVDSLVDARGPARSAFAGTGLSRGAAGHRIVAGQRGTRGRRHPPFERPHSLKQFVATLGARAVTTATEPANINSPADLAALETRKPR